MARSPTASHDWTTRPTTPPCPRAVRVADPARWVIVDDDALRVCEHLAADPDGPLLAVLSLNDGGLRCVACTGQTGADSCAWCGGPGATRLLAYAIELDCDHAEAPYHHRFLVSGWLCAECDRRGRPVPDAHTGGDRHE